MGRASIRADWRARLAAAGLDRPAALLEGGGPPEGCAGDWELLSKPGLGGRQRWRWAFDAGDGTRHVVYVKRYRRTPLRQQWDRLLRQVRGHSGAFWEYEQAQRLAELRIPAAPAVGYAERMRGPLESRSAVLLEAVRGEACDRHWQAFERAEPAAARGPFRHDLTRRLARFVSAFHQTGLRHRDLYLCHIFIQRDRGGSPEFTLIDLARTFRPYWRRGRWTIKDLAQLDASAVGIGATRTDRLRFVLAYLGLHSLTTRSRRLIARVADKSAWILRRIARKGG